MLITPWLVSFKFQESTHVRTASLKGKASARKRQGFKANETKHKYLKFNNLQDYVIQTENEFGEAGRIAFRTPRLLAYGLRYPSGQNNPKRFIPGKICFFPL